MKKKLYYLATIVLIVACFYFFFLRTYQEKKIIRQGNFLIEKIEVFRSKEGHSPSSLSELGLDEVAWEPIYYEKRGKNDYVIYYNYGLDNDSIVYYSDTKKWEDFYTPPETP